MKIDRAVRGHGGVSIRLAMLLALAIPLPSAVHGQSTEDVEDADAVLPTDPVLRLQERIRAGTVTLDHGGEHGYLPALLEAFDIPVSSQGLVFSRTSLQTDRISPWTPRALYFNDDVYIGWVQESPILEIASVDPVEGPAFYTLSQAETDQPSFVKETTTCLMCHESRVTRGVPGFIVRSVLTDRHGYVISSVHEGGTTDKTPLDERWGGWYVTGTQSADGHAGNTAAPLLFDEVPDPASYINDIDFSGAANVVDLDGRFDTEPYLTPHSDIVAIMVLTHQARVHNQIVYAGAEAVKALKDQDAVYRVTGEIPESGMLPSTEIRIANAAEALLRDMLFVGEAPLNGRVEGTSPFATEFSGQGPHDDVGRSLRELELENRLFRYPLSFLIYSASFTALPDLLKDAFYTRLEAVLTGQDESGDFGHLDSDDRAAILEILEATHPEFAARGR